MLGSLADGTLFYFGLLVPEGGLIFFADSLIPGTILVTDTLFFISEPFPFELCGTTIGIVYFFNALSFPTSRLSINIHAELSRSRFSFTKNFVGIMDMCW